jgi:hypothetical protein
MIFLFIINYLLMHSKLFKGIFLLLYYKLLIATKS